MIPRILITSLFFAATASVLFGYQTGGSTQACNGLVEGYEAPGGATTGTGRSPERAVEDADDNALHLMWIPVADCANCSTGFRCGSVLTTHFNTYLMGTPTWDPILKLWTVSCSWEGAYTEQKCHRCN